MLNGVLDLQKIKNKEKYFNNTIIYLIELCLCNFNNTSNYISILSLNYFIDD